MPDMINRFIQNQTDKILKRIDKKLNNVFYSPSRTTLDEFRAVISSAGGLQRTNRFVFNVPLPDFLRKTLIEDFTMQNLMSNLGMNVFDGTLGLLCQQISIPDKKLNTTSIKINGQTRTVPMNYTWDTVTAEFIETTNGIIYNTFYNWIDGINNPITNTGYFYDEFVKDLRLDYLNRDNEVVGYITLNEAYPVSVSRSECNYGGASYVTTKVSFTYLYQTNRDYSSNMLYNIINNIVPGAAGTLLNTATSLIDTYNPLEWVRDSMNSNQFTEQRNNGQMSLFTDPKTTK